ncbi:hypothetical protein DV737_g1364, partial [Chaetothyriales sp. CBS 132003]
MPDFFIYDTVRTKDGGVIGTVERTHLANASDTFNLADFPIVCWVQVPGQIILEFIASDGIPPRGYVFVIAAEDSRGAFLAAVDDLELVCRSFVIGDPVKRRDGLLGTVIDVDDTYDIRQLFRPEGPGLKHFSELDPEAPQYSIPDVPSRELKAAEDILEDDFVSYKNWLGVVKDTAITVVVKLEDNAVVAIRKPFSLYMPIINADKPLVQPADYHGLPRPRSITRFGDYPSVVSVHNPKIGSLVMASRQTLEHGRWLNGSFKPQAHMQGRVIAVVPTRVIVDWIVCNPFAHLLSREVSRPREEIPVYQNIHSFKRGDELRILPDLRLIDLSLPAELSVAESAGSSTKPNGLNGVHSGLNVGDCVHFRDAASAAIKYPTDGTNGLGFHRIDTELTNGWDMNVFSVTSRKQTVKIRWYDGSDSIVSSNEVSRFSSFEEDVRPCDIVVQRADLKMRTISNLQHDSTLQVDTFVDFDEMKYFETTCDLKPQRVGVVQSVDAHDRVATVRWYKDPQLLLTEGGTALTQDSYFGPIGDSIEESSTYEIMKFPALSRDHRDLVVIPPQFILQVAHKIIQSGESRMIRMSVIDRLMNDSRIPDAPTILYNVFQSARSQDILGDISLYDVTNVDWAGEIVALGLDGSITVRLSGARECRDETIDFDLVVANLHVDDLLASDDEESDDTHMEYSGASVISESIEYEGGERLDNDPNDENWESVDEEGNSDMDDDVEMTDTPFDNQPVTRLEHAPAIRPLAPKSELLDASNKASFCNLLSHLASERPPSFALLDIQPPPDQHQPHSVVSTSASPSTSSTFLKRMRQEHRILSTSLPPTIYIRSYESNLSLLRCLIIGPPDTPYENAPFLIDLALPPNYPTDPPTAYFHSWTSGLGRINPNLYEEGKICLSLLGTWPGKESKESWSQSATILQLVVSIQGLVMVKKPFFNEAGLEDFASEPNSGYETESDQYNEKAYVMARRFVKHALTQPPAGVEDVVAWLYFQPDTGVPGLLQDVLNRGRGILNASKEAKDHANAAASGGGRGGDTQHLKQLLDGAGRISFAEGFLRPLSRGAIVMLTRLLNELTDCLDETRRAIEMEDQQQGSDANSQPAITITTEQDTETTEHRMLVDKVLKIVF